jgi:hypothetical protein
VRVADGWITDDAGDAIGYRYRLRRVRRQNCVRWIVEVATPDACVTERVLSSFANASRYLELRAGVAPLQQHRD